MVNRINISPRRQDLIVYVVMIAVILSVFWQVRQYDFVNIDDNIYVIENSIINDGITLESIQWAFSTSYADFWHPVTWLSLMLDSQIYGLNAGGYHLTNLILHIMSSLLLFWLWRRMTGEIWKSAFVAAMFALHPLHVESVAWIAERKDVLSAFFWMLTLCLYTYYTEKPVLKRYVSVLFSFALALMSKPMVVTLPVVMIILDYWPLRRFESNKSKWFLWQFREKILFFILSAAFSLITLYTQHKPSGINIPFAARLANAPVSFVTYLEKTLWPYNMAVYYPFPSQIPLFHVIGAILLIILITIFVTVTASRRPYFFVGWIWYAVTILPVIGIFKIFACGYAMADRYHYIPSIGIAVLLAWGIPSLFHSDVSRKKILLPGCLAVIAVMAVLSWQQCHYWKNSVEL